MSAPMKPTILNLFTCLRDSGRRRKMLSALVIGLLFLAGAPFRGAATPGIPHAGTDNHSGFENITITIIKDYSVINDQPDIIQVNISPAPSSPPGEKIIF